MWMPEPSKTRILNYQATVRCEDVLHNINNRQLKWYNTKLGK